MPTSAPPPERDDAVAPHGADATRADSEVPPGRVAMVRGHTLVVANLDGSRRRNYAGLRSVLQYGMHPSWAPDGRSIYVHSGPAIGELHRLVLRTGAIERLTSASAGDSQWYPGATARGVFFMRETLGRYSVWRMGLDGSAQAPLNPTTPAYDDYYRPAVSPDGRHLAVSVTSQGQPGVRVFALATGMATSPLVPNATSPRWSPDGAWVAFSMYRFGVPRIMRPDGSGLRGIGSTPFGEWFDWTADGEWLIGNTKAGVALVRVADGRVLPLDWALGMWQPAVRR